MPLLPIHISLIKVNMSLKSSTLPLQFTKYNDQVTFRSEQLLAVFYKLFLTTLAQLYTCPFITNFLSYFYTGLVLRGSVNLA